VEAADGKIGSPIDRALLYCYHYDPSTGRYGFAIIDAIRIGGLATLVGIGIFMFSSLRRERRYV
jgi:protein SCO1/2